MEHLVPGIQQIDVQETVGLPDRFFAHGLKVLLGGQRRELFQQAIFFQLVAQALDQEELSVDSHGVAHEAQLLGADQSADHEVPASHKQGVDNRGARLLVHEARICLIVDDQQDLVKLAHLQLLRSLRDLALLLDDLPQGGLVPVLKINLLAAHIDLHCLLDVLLDRTPGIIDVDAGRCDVDAGEASPILLEDHADERRRLPALAWPEQDAGHRQAWHDGISRLLDMILGGRKQLDLAHLRTKLSLKG